MAETNIQTAVLKECKDRNIACRIFLVNGFQIQGQIVDYSDDVVIFVTDGKAQMIYKHAISTITPSSKLNCVK